MSERVDRVSFSFGMKLSTRKFESADFHISMTSDVNPGESWGDAFGRVQKFVEEKSDEQYDGIRKAFPTET